MNKFLTERYEDICIMAQKICKGNHEWEEVAHYAIAEFMEHERGQELVDAGKAMQFLSGIIWRSYNSSTSQYHTLYRQKNRVHSLDDRLAIDPNILNQPYEEYDHEQDYVVTAIEGIIEDMACYKTGLWFRATLFQMYMITPNYSELARKTGIPRNSISHAVDEAKQYIRLELKKQGIDYDF